MMAQQFTPIRILIVRTGSLGDIVHTIPAQQQIISRLPQAEIHWLAEPAYIPLLENLPGVHAVWPADTRSWRRRAWGWWHAVSVLRQTRKLRFDLAIDFQGLLKSALLARLSGASEIIGFSRENLREPAAEWFYSRTIQVPNGQGKHVIELNLELARFLGCNGESGPVIPLRIPTEAAARVAERLKHLGLREKPVLINPGAGWATKLWPPDRYAELTSRIEKELGLPVVFTYGPEEAALLDDIERCLDNRPLRSFPTSILELAALCRQSALMIAGDTGPLHLAVALGTPTVAILGPTSPWRNGPFNRDDPVIKRYLPCSDCYKRRCDQFICMEIPVQEVFEAVAHRLQK
jgi:heptosyltransferase I